MSAPAQSHHSGKRPGRRHRRHLCRARHAGACADRGPAAGRPAHHHHRSGELSRLRRGHSGPLADGADAGAGRACRHAHGAGHDRERRSGATPVHADRRFRRALCGADARSSRPARRPTGLGLPSEEKFKGFGVSACATCDGFFFRGKRVAVVGGGNTAVEEALFLTNFADQVTLIHRRETLRADKTNQMRLHANPKIEVIYDTVVEEVHGQRQSARRQRASASTTRRRARKRRSPSTDCSSPSAIRPRRNCSRARSTWMATATSSTAPDSTRTSVPGVFAAGDVKDKVFRQAVTAAGMGCMAALEAERFLAGGH